MFANNVQKFQLSWILLLYASQLNSATVPVVMWHGMGDCCCNPISMGAIQQLIEKQIPGIYVHSLMIGDNVVADTSNGFLMNVNDQVAEACDKIKNDTRLKGGYNAIGFSQGGQFLRAVAQRCPDPPMFNLVSMGGQHQGVYGLPHCMGTEYALCDYIRKMLNMGAYIGFIQNHIVQAEYWHDPLQEETYRKGSVFLADINQEQVVNETYKQNLLKLKNLVLVKFDNDSMVQPRESEWFGFYKSGQSTELYSMEESALYKEDKLGLKTMNEGGRIHLLSVPGDHLQFSDEWFINSIVTKYL